MIWSCIRKTFQILNDIFQNNDINNDNFVLSVLFDYAWSIYKKQTLTREPWRPFKVHLDLRLHLTTLSAYIHINIILFYITVYACIQNKVRIKRYDKEPWWHFINPLTSRETVKVKQRNPLGSAKYWPKWHNLNITDNSPLLAMVHIKCRNSGPYHPLFFPTL